MQFFSIPALVEIHLGIALGMATENQKNKANSESTEYLNYLENSKYNSISTGLASGGITGKLKLDVFSVGLTLDLEQKYLNQNWSSASSSAKQNFLVTSAVYGLQLGLRPNQTWDIATSFFLTLPVLSSSTRETGEVSGKYKIKNSTTYIVRTMVYALRSGRHSVGIGGDYTLSAMVLRNASDSDLTFSWFYSGYTARIESRLEIQ